MADLGMVSTFFAGLLGNVLVCLAVWISYSGRTTTDRMLAVSFPITAFYALGLEHVIATMFYFPFAYFHALATGASQEILSFAGPDGGLLGVSAFLAHLGPVTAGNIVGGGALVGVVYWFIYRRGVYRRA
jgi:formate/nitrite transporter FocA (FNT family)